MDTRKRAKKQLGEEAGSPRPHGDEASSRRRRLRVVVRPSLVADEDGLRLEVTLANQGPVAVSGTLRARVRGRSIELDDPQWALSGGGGPVKVSYRVRDDQGLSAGQRVSVRFLDKAGRSLVATSSGLTLASPLGLTIASLGVVGVVAVTWSDPDPIPPPSLPDPTPSAATAAEAFEVLLPDEILLDGFGSQDPLQSEWGLPGAASLQLGEGEAASGNSGIQQVELPVTLRHEGGPTDLGTVTLPSEVVFQDDRVDPELPFQSQASASSVQLPPDTPLLAYCYSTDDGTLIGGYVADGSGELVAGFELADDGSDLSWTVTVEWRGQGRFEYLDSVDPSAFDDSGDCAATTEAGISWSATITP